jgi:hypothetical protein
VVKRRLFEAAQDAGQGFGEGGVLEGDGVGDREGVFFDDACGDADELGVGTVVEEEVVAEVLLAVEAEEAGVAGCGVEREDAVAEGEPGDAFADLDDGSGDLVAEEAVEGEHLGVIAAAVDFEVGAAGEGGADAQDELAGAGGGDGHVLDAQVFLAAKNGGPHGSARSLAVMGLKWSRGHLSYFLIPWAWDEAKDGATGDGVTCI